ncbi:Crp/Fnr family transcriptional regulator [Fastidiosibacter lacustris]|uniref:Crp/Fnr family transcriptional regulator n=1 Tax=Fastidiosibacter lacustris TaxID=2056695 RepID=UPI000E34D78E|nr:helix-turn-helix domain-containing protein [Fastidiosibacter lacustris]
MTTQKKASCTKQSPRPKTCHFCDCHKLCHLFHVNPIDTLNFIKVQTNICHIKKGQSLYKTQDKITAIFIIRTGSFKLVNQNDYIVDFCLQGDALGFDAIESSAHTLTAIALEDSAICAFDYYSLIQALPQKPIVILDFLQLISKKLNLAINSLDTTQEAYVKLASFIYKLANHQKRCGYSNKSFMLPMKYLEIANHLNLSIETISRAFKSLTNNTILSTKHKEITILDFERLKSIATT